ncbi:MAG: site-specific DNA-methyltransferase [Dehalococcoidia bacterium]|nr:site-specific DNA-methyltransferase [Dehalococcoidia bacterium]
MTQKADASPRGDQLHLGLVNPRSPGESLRNTGENHTAAEKSLASGGQSPSEHFGLYSTPEETRSVQSFERLDTRDDFRQQTIKQPLLIRGCADDALSRLPADSVQTVVTSPPYWSLRDYDVDSQIGRDESLPEYIESIVSTFDQLRTVLRGDGTVWLNVGDAYTSGNRRYRAPDKKSRARAMAVRPQTPEGLKPKDLIGLPWRIAFALQDAGWWVRSEVIWVKPNAYPESVQDRPTVDHETVFLLSKSQNYYYDIQAVQGPNSRRLRTTWEISTDPQRPASGNQPSHPAVMPMELARRCIEITSRPGDVVLDPYAGSGTTLLSARDLNRMWIGIELKSSYVDLIESRLSE